MLRYVSKWPLPCGYLSEEPDVALQAQPRIFECRGFVVLEDEVAHPRKGVADDRNCQQVSESHSEEHCSQKLKEGEQSANEVESSAGSVGVLGEVKGVELFQGFVLFVHRLNIIVVL